MKQELEFALETAILLQKLFGKSEYDNEIILLQNKIESHKKQNEKMFKKCIKNI